MEDEDVARASILVSIRCGERRSITSFRNFVTPIVLPGYVSKCTIIGYQN